MGCWRGHSAWLRFAKTLRFLSSSLIRTSTMFEFPDVSIQKGRRSWRVISSHRIGGFKDAKKRLFGRGRQVAPRCRWLMFSLQAGSRAIRMILIIACACGKVAEQHR